MNPLVFSDRRFYSFHFDRNYFLQFLKAASDSLFTGNCKCGFVFIPYTIYTCLSLVIIQIYIWMFCIKWKTVAFELCHTRLGDVYNYRGIQWQAWSARANWFVITCGCWGIHIIKALFFWIVSYFSFYYDPI